MAHRVGQAMVYYIMNTNGKVIARSTVSSLEPSDYNVLETKSRMSKLDIAIEASIGDYRNEANMASSQIPQMDDSDIKSQLAFSFDLEPHDIDILKEEAASDPEIPHIDETPTNDIESTEFDKFLGVYMEIPGDDGGSKVLAKVKDRKRDHDGKLIGQSHSNPILDTAVYNVVTPDGNLHEYSANVIAENLWDQADDDGYNYR